MTDLANPMQQTRLLEAILFASPDPVSERTLYNYLPEQADVPSLLKELQTVYTNRGVTLCQIGDSWAFRTAADLAEHMTAIRETPRKLSRAAMETLAIIAYHQPITRAEIEDIRGVALGRTTLDILLEAGWIHPRGRRRVPGKPMTWGTTSGFLDQFGLETLDNLPGVEELKAAGLLEKHQGLNLQTTPEDKEE